MLPRRYPIRLSLSINIEGKVYFLFYKPYLGYIFDPCKLTLNIYKKKARRGFSFGRFGGFNPKQNRINFKKKNQNKIILIKIIDTIIHKLTY